MASTSERIFALLRSLAKSFLTPGSTTRPDTRRSKAATPTPRAGAGNRAAAPAGRGAYPGDFTGPGTVVYDPHPDGAPDPGEIVWAWVPFEEDHRRGKDRPVLLVGRHAGRLLGLMLTSKDHDGDRRGDNDYIDIGTGAWDRQGRPSEVKLDRVVQLSAGDLRREGAVLDARRFTTVAAALRSRHGWK